jgi:hypothetical protein
MSLVQWKGFSRVVRTNLGSEVIKSQESMVFWNVTPCSVVDRYQNVGELSYLKLEAAGSSETLMLIPDCTKSPQDRNRDIHCCENLRSRTRVTLNYHL